MAMKNFSRPDEKFLKAAPNLRKTKATAKGSQEGASGSQGAPWGARGSQGEPGEAGGTRGGPGGLSWPFLAFPCLCCKVYAKTQSVDPLVGVYPLECRKVSEKTQIFYPLDGFSTF